MSTTNTIESIVARITQLEAGPRVVPANAERFDAQAFERMNQLASLLAFETDDALRAAAINAEVARLAARKRWEDSAKDFVAAEAKAASARGAVNSRSRHRTEWAALAASHPAMTSGLCELVDDRWVPKR